MTHVYAHMRARITLADFAMFVPALAHFNEAINLRMSLDGKGYQTKCIDIYISNNTQSLFAESRSYDKPLERKKIICSFLVTCRNWK